MRVLDPLADSRWDEKLLAHDDASIFHTVAWARVLKDSYGYSCCYLAETDGERFSFLLPLMDVRSLLTGRRGISLPFTDFCEPLLNSYSPLPPGEGQGEGSTGHTHNSGPATTPGNIAGEVLLNALTELGRQRGWKYFEVRGGARIFGDAQPSMTVLSHTLDLTRSEDALFDGIKESTRRNIRKARREGVDVAIGTSEMMMDDFCRLNSLTRREHGLPPQPSSFFRHLQKHILSKDRGCVALATVHGQPVSASVYLHFGRNALYKYGASDSRFLSLRPNDLVMWEAIRWYRERGFQSLCFGRTELLHDGLRRYKTAWGVREQERPYYRYGFASAEFGRFKPRAAVRISAMIFRHLPLRVSQVIGTVLYRHVA